MPANKRVRHLTAKPFWKNGVMAVQWERQEVDGKVFHKNMTPEAAFETLMELIKSGDYRQYHLTGEGTLALKRTKKQKLLISDHWHITSHGRDTTGKSITFFRMGNTNRFYIIWAFRTKRGVCMTKNAQNSGKSTGFYRL